MSKYQRKAPKRQLRDRVLIRCGGQTEEIYFNKFKEKHKDGLKNVTVKVTTCKRSNPIAVVDEAISLQDSYDELWCVFDKDDFEDFDEAIRITIKEFCDLFCFVFTWNVNIIIEIKWFGWLSVI